MLPDGRSTVFRESEEAVAAAAEKGNKGGWRGHLPLLLLTLSYVLTFAGRQVMSVAIEPIKAEFGLSDTTMGLVAGMAVALVYGFLSVPAGRFADRANRRNLLAVSLLVWSFATLGTGLVAGFGMLLALRLMASLAEAGSTPPSLSMVVDLYPPRRQAMALSVYMSGPSVAMLLALGVGGSIIGAYGWRAAFIALGMPGILAAALVWFLVPEPHRSGHQGGQPHDRPHLGMLSTLRAIWAIAVVRWMVIGLGLSSFACMSYGVWLTAFLVRSHNMPLQQAGWLAGLIGTTAAIAGGLSSGWVTDRLVRRDERWRLRVPMLGMAITVPAAILVFLWPAESSIQWLGVRIPQAMVFVALFGFFSATWAPSIYAATSHVVPADRRAVANSMLGLASTLIGFGLGPVSVGLISDSWFTWAGRDALRYSLVCAMGVGALGVAAFYRASHLFRGPADR